MPPKTLLNAMNDMLKLHAVNLQTPLQKKKKKEEDTKQKKGKIIKHIMGIVKQAYLEP
jgi:hypothetical protein